MKLRAKKGAWSILQSYLVEGAPSILAASKLLRKDHVIMYDISEDGNENEDNDNDDDDDDDDDDRYDANGDNDEDDDDEDDDTVTHVPVGIIV